MKIQEEKMLKEYGERLFWNLYAKCYDCISKLTPYQQLQEEIFEYSALDSSQTLLDAGCGSGNFLRLLMKKGVHPSITAVDYSSAMMALAKQKYQDSNVRWERLDLNCPLPYRDNSYDRVVSSNVLFALKNPEKVVQEFQRVLKPGGMLVLATPRTSFNTNKILLAHLQTLKGLKSWVRFIPLLFPLMLATLFNLLIKQKSKKNTYHFFNLQELQKVITSANLSSKEIRPTYAKQTWLVLATKS